MGARRLAPEGRSKKRRRQRGAGVQPTPEEILSECETLLRTPLTDWDDIYFKLRASPLKDDFTRERFVRTPVSVIRWATKRALDHEQEQANLQALTTARLTATLIQIAHGFSGSKGPAPRLQVKDFLPFPDWKPDIEAAEGPDEVTRYLLSNLARARRIPMHVFSALMTPATRQS